MKVIHIFYSCAMLLLCISSHAQDCSDFALVNDQHTDISCGINTNGSFEVEAQGGTQPYRYRLNTQATTQNTGKFNNLSLGEYAVFGEDANGCRDTVYFSIADNGIRTPVASFETTNLGGTVRTFAVPETEEILAHYWRFSDANNNEISSSGEPNPMLGFPAIGNYTVFLKVTNSCGSDSIQQSIRVDATPIVSFGYDEIDVCTSDTIMLPFYLQQAGVLGDIYGVLDFDPSVLNIIGLEEGQIKPSWNAEHNSFLYVNFLIQEEYVRIDDSQPLFYIKAIITGEHASTTKLSVTDGLFPAEIGVLINGVPQSMNFSVQDCQINVTGRASLSGFATTFYNTPMQNVIVTIGTSSILTNSSGAYTQGDFAKSELPHVFSASRLYTAYTIEEISSPFEMFIAWRILNGNSDYRFDERSLVAADMDCSGSFTPFDITILRAMYLGYIDSYRNCPRVICFPAQLAEELVMNLQDYAPNWNSITKPSTTVQTLTRENQQDVICVEKGNLFQDRPGLINEVRERATLFPLSYQHEVKTDEQKVLLNVEEAVNIASLGATLEFDHTAYNFEGFTSSLPAFSVRVRDNQLLLFWYSETGDAINLEANETFLELQFSGKNVPVVLNFHEEKLAEIGKGDWTNIGLSLTQTAAKSAMQLDIAPNPVSGASTTLSFESDTAQQIEYTIVDIYGNALSSSRINVQKGKNQIQIDTRILEKGIYFVRLQAGNEQLLTQKFMTF